MKKITKILLIVIPWIVIAWIGGCYLLNNLFPWVYEEIGRIPSPDAKHAAVVLRGNRGAMSSYRYALCIVTPGQPYDTGSVNLDSSDLVVSNVTWSSPTRLRIQHGPKRIYYYKPVWPNDTENPEDRIIEVQLEINFLK
jgi:hypothetical protein